MIYPLLLRRTVFIWEFSFPLLLSFTYRTLIYLSIFLVYYVIVQWYKVKRKRKAVLQKLSFNEVRG